MTDKIQQAKADIEQARMALQRAQDRLDTLERQTSYPPEPSEDVVRFSVQFSSTGETYRYAAIKANGKWYTTGGQQFDSWTALIDWIRGHHAGPIAYIHPMGTTTGWIRVETP